MGLYHITVLDKATDQHGAWLTPRETATFTVAARGYRTAHTKATRQYPAYSRKEGLAMEWREYQITQTQQPTPAGRLQTRHGER